MLDISRSVSLQDGRIALKFDVPADVNFRPELSIQFSDNLGGWNNVADTVPVSSTGHAWLLDQGGPAPHTPPALAKRRFYRAQRIPR